MVTMNKDNKEMKHFRKWAEGRNPYLAATALTIVGLSKVCFEISELVQKGKRIEGDIPLPSLKTWLKLLLEDARQMKKNGEKYKTELEKIPPIDDQYIGIAICSACNSSIDIFSKKTIPHKKNPAMMAMCFPTRSATRKET